MSQTNGKKSELMSQLATMMESGISAVDAFGTLLTGQTPRLRKQLMATRRRLSQGERIADAAEASGLFEPLDAMRVRIAENAGLPEQALRRLATEYAQQYARQRQIRNRLMMPVAVLMLAAFVKPLPALFRGELTAMGYLAASLGFLLLIAVCAFLALRSIAWLRSESGRTSAAGKLLDRLAVGLPGIRKLNARREQCRFLVNLANLMEAGLPLFESVPLAMTAVRNSEVREDYSSILPDLEFGDPFPKAFARCRYADRGVVQHLSVADTAGTLPASIRHFCAMEQDDIDRTDDMISTWVPRIIYGLIAAWVAAGVVGGASPSNPGTRGL
ncbi:MAG: type II secretion system F family protein [Gammaproteobacteria bacterium]